MTCRNTTLNSAKDIDTTLYVDGKAVLVGDCLWYKNIDRRFDPYYRVVVRYIRYRHSIPDRDDWQVSLHDVTINPGCAPFDGDWRMLTRDKPEDWMSPEARLYKQEAEMWRKRFESLNKA